MSNRQAAEKLLRTIRGNFPPSREFRAADLADFHHLDQRFYERLSSLCAERGFTRIGDLEDLTAKSQGPDPRTVVRLFSRLDSGVLCAFYHVKPPFPWNLAMRLFGFGPARVFELETELTDGTFLIDLIAAEKTQIPAPDSVRHRYHDKRRSFDEVLTAHEERVSRYRKRHPGVDPIRLGSLEEVVASQNRMVAARYDHLAEIGWLSYDYLLRRCHGNEKMAHELRMEVEMILAGEQGPAATHIGPP